MLKRMRNKDSTVPLKIEALLEVVEDNATELMIKAFCLRQSKHYAAVNQLKEAV